MISPSPSPTSPTTTTPKSNSPATSPTLTALKPVDMTPQRSSAKTPVKMLQNIEYIEVAKAANQDTAMGKTQVYVASVFMTQKGKDLSCHREPDFQVRHTVSQFCSLRNNVHACVQRGHQGTRCKFCEPLARFVTFGEGQALPFAAMAFSPGADASSLLSSFLVETLRQSQRGLETLPSSGCRGQHQLPRLLQAFIFQSPQHF